MFIMGTNLILWLKLLMKNKFNISVRYIPRVFLISLIVTLFTPLIFYEHFKYKNKIKTTKIKQDPVFIIGHWRSGTTYLQNLLLNDNQYGYLNLVEATFPYLLLENYKLSRSLMKPLIPKTRPMDSMKMNVDTPQEHEFALTNLCLLSPLTSLFFFNKENEYLKYASFADATQDEFIKWKESFTYLLQKLTFKNNGKQLLLKNPLDSFRIKHLLEMFPNSKFIHIYRNPYEVFFSMIKLYEKNTHLFWLHKPDFNLESFIFKIYLRLYQKLYEDSLNLRSDQFIEVRYEDLVKNPLYELRRIYEKLSLGDFNLVEERIKQYIAALLEYKVDIYDLTSDTKNLIQSNWSKYIKRWKYDLYNLIND